MGIRDVSDMANPTLDEEEDYPAKPKRFWTYGRDDWDPYWWQIIGLPYFGSDEWGRRTMILGFSWTGYICVALWTCWCEHCHLGRSQTYEDARPALERAMRERQRSEVL